MPVWSKYALITLAILTLLLVGLIAFSQTSAFKHWLAARIITEASKSLNGELRLGKITGNMVTHFEVTDLAITRRGETVLSLSKLTIRLLPYRLLKKQIAIKAIQADSLHLYLRQQSDSLWNVAGLLKPAEGAVADSSAAREITWRLMLDELWLRDAGITLQPQIKIPGLPQEIEIPDVRLSLAFADSSLDLHLRKMQLRTQEPAVKLDELAFRLTSRGQEIVISNLTAIIQNSRLSANGAIHLTGHPSYQIHLTASPLELSDLKVFLPDFPIIGKANLSLDALYEADSLQFDVAIARELQTISAQGRVQSISNHPVFFVQAKANKFDWASWVETAAEKSAIDATIAIEGSGTDMQDANIKIAASLANFQIANYSAQNIQMQADYAHGDLRASLSAKGGFGLAKLDGRIEDVSGLPSFDFSGSCRRLNLAPLLLNDSLQTDLNFSFSAQGTGPVPAAMHAELFFDLQPSTILGMKVDSITGRLLWDKGNYSIARLRLNSPTGRLDVSGSGNPLADNDLLFAGEIFDIGWLKTKMEADSIRAGGIFSGRASGRFDSLSVSANYRLAGVMYNVVAVDSAQGDIQLLYRPDSVFARGSARLLQGYVDELELDSAQVEGKFSGNTLDATCVFSRENLLNGMIDFRVINESLPRLVLRNIDLHLKDRHWIGGGDSVQIFLGPDYYDLKNVRLTSADQYIRAEGAFRWLGEENLQLEMSHIDLQPFASLLENPANLSGSLDADAKLTGSADSLFFSGKATISNGIINDFAFQSLHGNFEYNQNRLSWNLMLDHTENQSLKITGFLPMNLSLANSSYTLLKNQPTSLRIEADSLNLALIQAFSSRLGDVSGIISCNLGLENTLDSPHLNGFIKVRQGTLSIPEYGARYNNLQFAIGVNDTSISIDGFQIKSGEGTLKASGYGSFDSQALERGIHNVKMVIYADDFLAADNPAFNILLKGEARLTGSLDAPKYSGSVIILRSRFDVPALANVSGQSATETQSMLVQALKGQDTTITRPTQQISPEVASDFVKNLRGSMKINIPRNTWLRSPEMNIEISGDLELVKNSLDFEMFGSINTIRGTYDLYGRRFEIQKGTVQLQGGATIDPVMDIEAQHVFRGLEGNKDYLALSITGRMLEPTVKFTLNNTAIEETDAISYLVFGRAFDQLTQGEKSNLMQQPGSLGGSAVTSALAGQLVGQLSSTLQKRLNLDVIEFQGEQNWRQATLVVGKYLTNDLFMSYQRQFSIGRINEVVPEQVAIEYEIIRNLFLQAIKGDEKTTGFDLIWKFDW